MKLRRSLIPGCLALLAAAAPFAISPASAQSAAPAKARAVATHAGMTWTVREQRTNGEVHVGYDATTNAYVGDTPATTSLPVLCLYVAAPGDPVPADITPDFYNGWSKGLLGITPSVKGSALTSRAKADARCVKFYGEGWRMAEFHDGYFAGEGNDQYAGGWSYWAHGTIPAGVRLWVAIDDQPANPWS